MKNRDIHRRQRPEGLPEAETPPKSAPHLNAKSPPSDPNLIPQFERETQSDQGAKPTADGLATEVESTTEVGPFPKSATRPPWGTIFKRVIKSRACWLILLVVLIGGGISKTNYFWAADRLFARWGVAVVAPFACVQALISVSPFPGELIAVHNSMLLGFSLGTVCNWIGWMLAAILQYSLARRLTVEWRSLEVRTQMPTWMRGWPLDHPAFLICGRWLPMGGHLVNTSAGMLHVPWRRHLWCSAIGIVPVAVLFAGLGAWSRQNLLEN